MSQEVEGLAPHGRSRFRPRPLAKAFLRLPETNKEWVGREGGETSIGSVSKFTHLFATDKLILIVFSSLLEPTKSI